MKTKLISVLLICCLSILSCNKKEKEPSLIEKNENCINSEYIQRWSVPGTESELNIKNDGSYSYGHGVWDGPFASGKYSMENGKLKLLYPDSIDINKSNEKYSSHDLEVLFKNQDPVFLEYDSEYMDFNCVGCLRTGDLIITTFYGEKSPANKIYTRKGIKVKKLPDYSFIISSDNMKLREKPSLDSKFMTFRHGWKYRNFPYDIISNPENVVWLKEETNLLLKGYAVQTIACTEEETQIDGISAPWYLILDSGGEEDFTHEFWVWGGYSKLIQGDSYYYETSEEEKTTFICACVEQGIIKIE